jgi:hypothetical protein
MIQKAILHIITAYQTTGANEMKNIYKTEQGKVTPGTAGYIDIPKVAYYEDYGDAKKAIGNHGGELSKYEDCFDADFSFREVWVERNIPESPIMSLLAQSFPPENVQTIIWRIAVI